jgi:8-oxo-dGTP pyrophosphatase MutT (NUDIX family)
LSGTDEWVDLLDAAGQPIGKVTRREMRARRLPHRGVYILVFSHRQEIFIHQRTTTKDVYPGFWDVTIGGVVAAGETFDAGACREALEELGVTVLPEFLFPIDYQDAFTLVRGMAYRAIHGGPFKLQPEEVLQGEFVTLTEALCRAEREPFCPDGLAVLKAYLESTAQFAR